MKRKMKYNSQKRGIIMTIKNKHIAEYGHFYRIDDKKILEEIRNIDEDSDSLSPESMFKIAQLMNLNITYEELCE
jgi:hypothetical protein